MTVQETQAGAAAAPPGTAPDPGALLEAHFGFSNFLPGQREVIEILLSGHGALAVFPTGGGKSLCYQLPALALDGVTVVVSPLIALMKDQIDFLRGRGIAAARLDSSLDPSQVREVNYLLESGTLKLLYVAPERFNNERFLASLRRRRIALFAVDEAHCISEWGHNFRPDYLKLADTARALRVDRVLALTATATPAVTEDICRGFEIEPSGVVVTGFYRPNLKLCTTPVSSADRDALLLDRLRSRPLGPGIVYVTLQKTAERVAEMLQAAGLPARAYHAGMDPDIRSAVQEEWMASDKGIVVATIAFGMGIDKREVRYVYHYNLPKSLESYSQEIGRAGRDGNPSIVELLACTDDVPVLENFGFGDTPTESAVRGLVEELLAQGDEFDISLYDLSSRHDIRQLVMRTALTYLELAGVLRQGTPFYAGYEVKPLLPLAQISAQFKGEPAQLVADLFAHAKKGKVWYTLNPDDAAAALGKERTRIVRALEYLEEHGWVILKAGDARQRYTRLKSGADPGGLTADLMQRFERREMQESVRLQQVLDLVTHDGCQSNALVEYFGEKRIAPCGHCTFCATGRRYRLMPPRALPPLPAGVDVADLQELRSSHPGALSDPRQIARFLCGLTSPALTRAKLSRHALFGALEAHRFQDVRAWAQGLTP